MGASATLGRKRKRGGSVPATLSQPARALHAVVGEARLLAVRAPPVVARELPGVPGVGVDRAEDRDPRADGVARERAEALVGRALHEERAALGSQKSCCTSTSTNTRSMAIVSLRSRSRRSPRRARAPPRRARRAAARARRRSRGHEGAGSSSARSSAGSEASDRARRARGRPRAARGGRTRAPARHGTGSEQRLAAPRPRAARRQRDHVARDAAVLVVEAVDLVRARERGLALGELGDGRARRRRARARPACRRRRARARRSRSRGRCPTP